MGCGSSTVLQPRNDAATAEFDRILEEEKLKDDLHFKLLCLGAGESGKSTIIKQLVFLHKAHVLSKDEKQSYTQVLQENTLGCMSTLIKEAQNFGYDFSEEHHQLAEMVLDAESRHDMSMDVAIAVTTLWRESEAISQTYARRSEFWLLDCADYYFNSAERFAEEGFEASEEDIILARKRTTGVVETQLKYGGCMFTVVDVGGQRSERRKWISCFADVSAILFTVNLAGYCSVLFEDRAVNRMQESLKLFEETMSNPLFAETPVFLILNKKDLFERLIRQQSLKVAFPDFDGDPNDVRQALEFIAMKYEQRLPAKKKGKLLVVILMAARVRQDVRYAFEDIRDTLQDLNRKGIAKAEAKLTALREKYKNQQIEEMARNSRLLSGAEESKARTSLGEQGSQLRRKESLNQSQLRSSVNGRGQTQAEAEAALLHGGHPAVAFGAAASTPGSPVVPADTAVSSNGTGSTKANGSSVDSTTVTTVESIQSVGDELDHGHAHPKKEKTHSAAAGSGGASDASGGGQPASATVKSDGVDVITVSR